MHACARHLPALATSLLAFGLDGCAAIDLDAGERTTAIAEGTPEAVGVLALLNDPGTTLELLDHDVRLDRRAATNLMAHRNGPDAMFATADDDPFDSVAEVDAVPWIGPASLERLIAYAGQAGWVPGEDDHLGVYDDVPFTVGEAEMVLTLVNGAPETELDLDVGLDRRAVASILEARPLETVARLASLYYVGTSALARLKAYCTASCESECGAGRACWQNACVADLDAVRGLLGSLHDAIEVEELPAVMAAFATSVYDPTRPELGELNAAPWTLAQVEQHFASMFASLRDIRMGALVTGDARGNPYLLLDEHTMLIADFTSLQAVVEDPEGGYAWVVDSAAGDPWFEERSEGWYSLLLVEVGGEWRVASLGQGFQ